ncbi:hypothetical protein Q7P36_007082 [Cladosporium allicinum]
MKTFTATALASAALLSLASAQEQYTINPDSVSEATRKVWCNSQTTQCPLICLQPPSETFTTNDNTCDSETLQFSCECGDGLRPNVTQYTQTMPFFICQEWGNQCVTGCNGDNACSSSCRQDHPCGAQDPIKPNSSTISSTMSSSASRTASDAGATTDSSGGTVYSGFGGASATGDSSSAEESSGSDSASSSSNNFGNAADSSAGRAAALQFGQTFGILALAGAFFGGFALVL